MNLTDDGLRAAQAGLNLGNARAAGYLLEAPEAERAAIHSAAWTRSARLGERWADSVDVLVQQARRSGIQSVIDGDRRSR